MVRYLRIKRM